MWQSTIFEVNIDSSSPKHYRKYCKKKKEMGFVRLFCINTKVHNLERIYQLINSKLWW